VTGTTIKLRLRDLTGRPREVEFTEEGDFSSPGSGLRQRLVATNGSRFVLKSVPPGAGAANPALFEKLDNEIRAGARLGYVYTHPYPAELARLAGYNVDVEEPFALLHAYAGRPVTEMMGGLDDHRRRQLQIGLLRALQLTAAAGVVHGAVSIRHLWWDGAGVRLVDFDSAQWAGEPRRTGPGPADARDDVLLAGRVIRQLVLGETAGARPDHGHDPESLRVLLAGVFQPVEHRPYAEDLLDRLKVRVTAPPLSDPEAGLAEGRRIFDGFGAPVPAPAAGVGGTGGAGVGGAGVGGAGDHGIVPPRPVPARKRGVWRRFLVPMLLATMAGRVGPR
jgi:hypothetical protein